ncbi:MAG: DUF3373 domain-containing protein [Nitrospirota bacterium]
MRKFVVALLSLALLLPLSAFAADQGDLLQKIEALSRELESLKAQMHEMQKKETVKEERITMVEKKAEAAEAPSWFKIGGDYRARFDSLRGESKAAFVLFAPTPQDVFAKQTVDNETLLTNRFGLNMEAKAMEDITVKARLLMYKVWGHETEEPIGGSSNGFFADRFFLFDGNVGHVPSDNTLRVDQAYATWSNVFNQPVWFSVGRRPSTGGVPTNIRQNVEKVGNAGVPGLLIDYAFDGLTLGYAPDIDALPGAYAKFCYGRGFDSGYKTAANGMDDVDFIGINVVPYDTDTLHLEFQYSRAFNIFAFPESNGMLAGFMVDPADPTGTNVIPVTVANTNVGDIDQYGMVAMGKIEKVGPGDLNLFLSAALSVTHPNENTLNLGPGVSFGLLGNANPSSKTGWSAYVGGRYDIAKTGTKIGLEYNYGSKNWITFTPAADDIWTGKLGTRGSVYEAYIIQELNKKPIAKRGKAFFRLGYQYYDFDYTGSNNWMGAPVDMDDVIANTPLFFAPLKNAHDIYLTFDVMF